MIEQSQLNIQKDDSSVIKQKQWVHETNKFNKRQRKLNCFVSNILMICNINIQSNAIE